METGDASCEVVGHIEKSAVAIGDFDASLLERSPLAPVRGGAVAFRKQLYGAARPDRPMTQKPADHPALHGLFFHLKDVRRQQVHNNVVIVAGIESDIVAARFGYGTDNVEGLVAVERGN